MQEFYDKLPELIRKHSKIAIATVISAKGSTPRKVGAKIMVLPDGATNGTLGGGKLELLVTGCDGGP